jgi:hypothetical protein
MIPSFGRNLAPDEHDEFVTPALILDVGNMNDRCHVLVQPQAVQLTTNADPQSVEWQFRKNKVAFVPRLGTSDMPKLGHGRHSRTTSAEIILLSLGSSYRTEISEY